MICVSYQTGITEDMRWELLWDFCDYIQQCGAGNLSVAVQDSHVQILTSFDT